MTATYQIAHNGTYALPGLLKRTAHIAGYALAEMEPRLRLEEQNACSRALGIGPSSFAAAPTLRA
jgi:hypothetical protein